MVVPAYAVSILVLAARGDATATTVDACPNHLQRHCSCLLSQTCLISNPDSCFDLSAYYECVEERSFKPKHGQELVVKENTIMCDVEKATAFCGLQLHREGCPEYDDYARGFMETACKSTVDAIPGCVADCTGAGYMLPGVGPALAAPAGVSITSTINNVDFNKLAPITKLELRNKCQEAVAAYVGVDMSVVSVTLQAGSIIVNAVITKVDLQIAGAAKSPSAITALQERILTLAKGIPAVVAAASGEISVVSIAKDQLTAAPSPALAPQPAQAAGSLGTPIGAPTAPVGPTIPATDPTDDEATSDSTSDGSGSWGLGVPAFVENLVMLGVGVGAVAGVIMCVKHMEQDSHSQEEEESGGESDDPERSPRDIRDVE